MQLIRTNIIRWVVKDWSFCYLWLDEQFLFRRTMAWYIKRIIAYSKNMTCTFLNHVFSVNTFHYSPRQMVENRGNFAVWYLVLRSCLGRWPRISGLLTKVEISAVFVRKHFRFHKMKLWSYMYLSENLTRYSTVH